MENGADQNLQVNNEKFSDKFQFRACKVRKVLLYFESQMV